LPSNINADDDKNENIEDQPNNGQTIDDNNFQTKSKKSLADESLYERIKDNNKYCKMINKLKT